MRKLNFFKTLLVVATMLMGSTVAWADKEYTTVFTQNYSGSDYATGWSAATAGRVGWAQFTRTDLSTTDKTALLVFHNGKNNGASSTYSALNGITLYTESTDYKVEFDMALQGNYGTTAYPSSFTINFSSGSKVDISIANLKTKGAGYNSTVKYTPNGGSETSLCTLYQDNNGAAQDLSTGLTSENAASYFVLTKVYHVTISGDETNGVDITISGDLKIGEEDKVSASAHISDSFERMTTFVYNSGRNGGQQMMLDNLTASIHSNEEVVPNPIATITGVNGTSRTVTLTLGTGSVDGTTMAYSTNSDMSESTAYTVPFTVSTTGTIYFQSTSPTSAKSEIQSINVTCEALTLNAPVITRSGNTVIITSDQSDLDASPSATIYYTYGDGDPVEYSSEIAVAADATITAYATATGYTNSASVSRAVALFPTDVVKVIDAPENNTYTTGALSGTDVAGTNATFQALIIDGAQWGGEDVYVQSTNFGFRNGGLGKDWYFDSTSDVWLLVKELKAGDIVVVSTTYQASNLENATYTEKYSEGNNYAYTVTSDGDVEIAFKKPNSKTMHYFYGIYAYGNRNVSKTISAAGYATYCSPYALNFSGVSGLTAYIAAKDGTKVKFTPVDNVPANTGVLLKGAEGNYSIPVIASSTTDVTDNILTGVLVNTSIEIGDYGYVLMNVSNVVGFYKTDTEKGFTVGANTAYIKSDKDLSRMFIGFDDDEVETTGINEVKNVKANNAIYNLKGMKVKTAQKGLYIINGKKVVK